MGNYMGEQQLLKGMRIAMTEGTVSVPHLLVKYYRKLQLSETEVMILIHLIDFKEKEQNDFPTIDEISARMTAQPDEVIRSLQKLMKTEMINIDERIDPLSGIRYEAYNFTHVYGKLAACRLRDMGVSSPDDEDVADGEDEQEAGSLPPIVESGFTEKEQEKKDIFTVIEKEFARLLSPMECETISGWLDKDQYPEELILAALKEAVFAGKVHFRYIDRILLEWKRNRVFTVEQAREHARKFRGER